MNSRKPARCAKVKEAVHLAFAALNEIFVHFDDHGAAFALRFSIFRFATLAWATAASCWSPRKIRILLDVLLGSWDQDLFKQVDADRNFAQLFFQSAPLLFQAIADFFS